MTELVLNRTRALQRWGSFNWPPNGWRLLVLAVLAALVISSAELRSLVFSAISDAYLQVTVFVAGTLAIVYAFENAFDADLGRSMSRTRLWQAPIASFLGALPGCGGAIVVVTQYTKGYISFGSVVAVLIATMGDAAFLLLAREPITGIGVMVMGIVVGSLSGWAVDWVHGRNFMRATPQNASCPAFLPGPWVAKEHPVKVLAQRTWIGIVVPAGLLGLLVATQFETDTLFGPLAGYQPTLWIGVVGGVLCLAMWAFAARATAHTGDGDCPYERSRLTTAQRIIKDTNFVTSWVVVGFLSYELAVHFAGAGVEHVMLVWAPFVPLAAILIGFIPGCGPQIVTTTLYLSGAIPLSAQLGNAIANDGDALFPAIALAPRAAILATLYSAVPALIIGYGWYFFME